MARTEAPTAIVLIPWNGGLMLRRNPTLAHPSQLAVADDIVYNFDGTRRKRGGQSHRNRIPIPGGVLDDHFTKDPPGDWTSSDATPPITLEDDTIWRGAMTSSGSVSLTRLAPGQLPAAFTAQVRIETADLVTVGSYFEVLVDPGTGLGLYRLGIRFDAAGVKMETSDSVFELISTTTGTMEDWNLTLSGQELYDTENFHTWKFEMSEDQVITIYFDELLIFTSNAITTLGEAGTQASVVLRWNTSSRIDVAIDDISVNPGIGVNQQGEESAVMGLWDFPRVADGLVAPTAHRMVASVNSRIYIDTGDHKPTLIADNYDNLVNSNPRLAVDCASFMGKLIIARENAPGLLVWDSTAERAVLIPNSPPGSILRVHRNRLFVMGEKSNPSRLSWSGLLNEKVWTTEETGGDFVDSGFEPIDPEDGGIGIGLGPSFHGQLIIYKTTGIYRLVGDNPGNFVMEEITKSIGGASHHSIQNVGNDQYFVSPYGVHSLLTTQKFGDYEESFLSHDIRNVWNESINPAYLRFAWGYNNEPLDRYELLVSVKVDQGTSGVLPNRVLSLHYGVQDELHPVGRWSVKKIRGGSATMFTDENDRRRAFVGGWDGFINRQDERFQHDFPVHFAAPSAESAVVEEQNLFIMRHMANNEIFGWDSLPYFDGVIYNLQYDDPAQLTELAAIVNSGRRWWRYYTILDYPLSGTLFGGKDTDPPPRATWFNWFRNNIQFTGLGTTHRRMRVGNTVTLFNAYLAPDGQRREMIPWGIITQAERQQIIAQMIALANAPGGLSIPASGVFLDQAWLDFPEFFIKDTLVDVSGHGNVKEGNPKLTSLNIAGTVAGFGSGGIWTTHRDALMEFYTEMTTAMTAAGMYALKNGEHRTISTDVIPKPWMLENAWNNNIDGGPDPGGVPWTTAKAHFIGDTRNLISLNLSSAVGTEGVPEAIAHWQEHGGWISFISDGSAGGNAKAEAAYVEVAAILAANGWPVS